MDTPLMNGLFVFVLGILVVFGGMLIIVLSVQAFGKALSSKEEKPAETKVEPEPIVEPVAPALSDDVPDEVKAAIVAAITAYYFTAKSKPCDFVVRRIKRF